MRYAKTHDSTGDNSYHVTMPEFGFSYKQVSSDVSSRWTGPKKSALSDKSVTPRQTLIPVASVRQGKPDRCSVSTDAFQNTHFLREIRRAAPRGHRQAHFPGRCPMPRHLDGDRHCAGDLSISFHPSISPPPFPSQP